MHPVATCRHARGRPSLFQYLLPDKIEGLSHSDGVGDEVAKYVATIRLRIRQFRPPLSGGHPTQRDFRSRNQVRTLEAPEACVAAFDGHSMDEAPVAGTISVSRIQDLEIGRVQNPRSTIRMDIDQNRTLPFRRRISHQAVAHVEIIEAGLGSTLLKDKVPMVVESRQKQIDGARTTLPDRSFELSSPRTCPWAT